jgi:hypothetical protein
VWLRTELTIAAKAAVRTKGTYLAAHHAQIKVLARDAISEPQADAA